MTPRRKLPPGRVAAVLAAAWIAALVGAAAAAAYRIHGRFGAESAAQELRRYFRHDRLAGEDAGRVNVLLLGVPGAGYNGARMTDTILLLSIFPQAQRATLVSIPRDLAIDFPDGTRHKFNEAYGLADPPGRDAFLRIAEDAFGLELPYYATVDISGLEQIVDAVGGIWVWVDRPFHDLAFRDAGNPHASFQAGWSHMIGERALVYARARRGTNGEGTDYARAVRQQKVLVALRDRASSLRTRLDPLVLWRLANAMAAAIETNLRPWEMAALRRLMDGVEIERLPASVFTDVLDAAYEADGVFRLRPRGDSLESIRHRLANPLERPSVADRLAALALECGDSLLHSVEQSLPPIPVPRWVWDLSGPIVDTGVGQNVRGIVIHHDGIRHRPHKSGEAKAAALRKSVLRSSGWTDLPYHYLVDVDGRILEGAAESATTRTHTWTDPSDLLHIALLGNYAVDRPTEAQVESLLRLVDVKAREYDLPASHIRLHSELVATNCPGALAAEALQPLPRLPCDPAGTAVRSPDDTPVSPLRRAGRIEQPIE